MLDKYLRAIIKPLNRMAKSTRRKEDRDRERERDAPERELKFINGGQGA